MWLADRLEEAHRRGGVVADDRHLGRPLAGGVLRQLHQDRHDLIGLRVGGGRGLEHVVEAAIGDRVGIGQGQPGQLGPLRHLGRGQGEGGQPAAHAAHQVGVLRQHPLRRALRRLRGGAGVEDQQLELGAAERLDAARLVHVIDRHLGAVALQDALFGPGAGQRHQQGDLDLLRLRGQCRAARRARHRRRAAQRQRRAPSDRCFCHVTFLPKWFHASPRPR